MPGTHNVVLGYAELAVDYCARTWRKLNALVQHVKQACLAHLRDLVPHAAERALHALRGAPAARHGRLHVTQWELSEDGLVLLARQPIDILMVAPTKTL